MHGFHVEKFNSKKDKNLKFVYTRNDIVVRQATLSVLEPTVCVIQQTVSVTIIYVATAFYFSKPPCFKGSIHHRYKLTVIITG